MQQILVESAAVLVADSMHKEVASPDSMAKDSGVLETNQEIRSIRQRQWVEDSYENVAHLPSKDFESVNLGLYYIRQMNSDAWSALGYNSISHGFAIQLMSGNRLKGENYSLYGGAEFGVQYFNHSPLDSIVVNLTNHKLAESFIRSRTTDLAMRWQFEYSGRRIKPYSSVSAGVRLMTTQQKVSQIDVEGIYDPSNVHSISNRSAAVGCFGLGAKFMISPWLYLDVRKEWSFGSNKVAVVDYNNVNLEGVLYAPDIQKMSFNSSTYKIGVVFNFGKKDTRTLLDQEAHFEYSCIDIASQKSANSMQVVCKDQRQIESYSAENECNTTENDESSDSFRYEEVVTHSYWVDDYYEYRNIVPGHDFSNGSLALHYMKLNHVNPSGWKSMGYQDSLGGLSIQFMSKNLTSRRNIGLYFGGDIDVHFWDKSETDTLFINSTNIDAGYGFDKSTSGDILLRTIVEFNPARIVPYATAALGLRLFDMNANVKGMLNSREYESNFQDRTSLKTAAFNVGFGSRIKLSQFIHLDVRREWTFALSGFNVLPLGEYMDPSREEKLSFHTSQWKVGLIFDMSIGNREYALVEPGHQKNITSELYYNHFLDSLTQEENTYLSLTELHSLQPCDSNMMPNVNYRRERTRDDPNPQIIYHEDHPAEQIKSKPSQPSRKKPFPGVRKKEIKVIDW